MTVLAGLAALESTWPFFSCPSKYSAMAQETTVTVLTILAVWAVVMASPLKLNPPFSSSWAQLKAMNTYLVLGLAELTADIPAGKQASHWSLLQRSEEMQDGFFSGAHQRKESESFGAREIGLAPFHPALSAPKWRIAIR